MEYGLDIVFLGGLFPKDTENEIYMNSKGGVQEAANAFQWNIIKGLDECNGKPIKIINSLFIGAYPKKFKKLIIKTFKFQHMANADDINVGFINIWVIKQFLKYWLLKPYLKNWAIERNEKKVIIAYSLNYTFVKCLKYIKKINPQVKTCIIVPDLPQYMNLSNKISIIYKLLKNAEIRNISRNMKYIDHHVLLTKHMAKFLQIQKNYTIVEGISTETFENTTEKKDEEMKIILYTGTLNERYGVLELVRAFNRIENEKYRLILCGIGDSEEKIREYARLDSRIIYKGQVLRKDVLNFQKKATVLVNPRTNNEQYTKYSFPSKILEYLSSGTPVVAYKLEGIPDEYDDFIYYINGNTDEDIAMKLIEVCEKSEEERRMFGIRAKEFVMYEKSSRKQCSKILNNILLQIYTSENHIKIK